MRCATAVSGAALYHLLVILGFDLEEGLRMGADGANSGRLFADDDVAAVTALPYCIAVFREDELAFDIGEQFAIAVFVSFFDGADHFEELGDVIEAFFASFFRKRGIHIGPFVVFALSGVEKVFGSRRDFVVVEAFEPELSLIHI